MLLQCVFGYGIICLTNKTSCVKGDIAMRLTPEERMHIDEQMRLLFPKYKKYRNQMAKSAINTKKRQ